MSERNGFHRNITIVKRVSGDQIHFDYYPNERVAQSWIDTFNHGNANGHAKIVDSKDAPSDSNADDTRKI